MPPEASHSFESQEPLPPPASPIALGSAALDFEPNISGHDGVDYRLLPYRPDSIVDGWGTEYFTVRAASIRGWSHRYYGSPRQDDMALVYLTDRRRLVIAVADGVSDAPQSHLGSAAVVRYVTQWFAERGPANASDIDWTGLFRGAAFTLVNLAAQLSSIEGLDGAAVSETAAEEAVRLLSTTLVCVALDFEDGAKAVGQVASVGDSGLQLLSVDGFSRVTGGKQRGGSPIFSSVTPALPRVQSAVESIRFELDAGSVLLVHTDGFSDPLGSGIGDVGRLFRQRFESPPSMLEFLQTLDFWKETWSDDRTLVAVWASAGDREVGTGG